MDDEIDLRQYLALIWRRRYLIGALMLLGITVASLGSLMAHPEYEASTVIALSEHGNPMIGTTAASTQPNASSPSSSETFATLISNEAVARQVRHAVPSGESVPLDAMLHRIRLAPVPGSGLVTVTARGASPDEALALVDDWTRVVVRYLALAEQSRNALRQQEWQVLLLRQEVQELIGRIALYETRLTEAEQGTTGAEREVTIQSRPGSRTLILLSPGAPQSPAQIRRVIGALQAKLASEEAALAVAQDREAQMRGQVNLFRTVGTAQVVVPAARPTGPVGPPHKQRYAVLGGVLGLVAGTLLTLVIDSGRPAPSRPPSHPGDPTAADPSRRPRESAGPQAV